MPDPRVYIAQCLCGPNRHAICALAGEADSAADAEELRRQLSETVGALLREALNPWCAICGSAAWTYELGRSRFRTLTEAKADLDATAAANAAANALFGTHGPTKPRAN